MEPVLQRFGDVTIQRVERPKPGPPNQVPSQREIPPQKDEDMPESSSDEEPYESEEDLPSSESPVNIKRTLDKIFPDSDLSVKKFKPTINKIPPEIPSNIIKRSPEKRLPEDILNNFSDDDIPSDFGTDSELDSEEELNINKPKERFDDDSNNSSSFFEKLVEGAVEAPFEEAAISSISANSSTTSNKSAEPPPPIAPADGEDYEYDIKEKLKEMGEISFETVKKGDKPKKMDVKVENEVVVTPAKKAGAADDDIEKKTLASVNMRRNIREVMDETKLDEATLAAQRLEAERLQRVQEQQKLLRELQRQAAQERMQNKVISLLQGNNFTRPGTSTTRIGNTVLVKLPNGQTKPMTRLPKKPFDLIRMHKGADQMSSGLGSKHFISTLKKPKGHLTPSVSIAPVTKRIMPPMMSRKPPSDTESEGEELPPILPRRKSKDQPTTTIDISSDDDCIVVSEPEGDPADDEPEDDPTNSGMHTNDEFNQPDSQGRVLINVGHPESDPDIFLAPQIARIIKPHQIGGVRFLYDNVIESTSRFEKSAGFGCILAHSMGLGKTLQIVCFSDIFLRHTPAKTILCIMPINTLQNWLNEYNMWVPTEENVNASPLMAHGEVRPRNFNLHVLNDSHKSIIGRAKVIRAWRSGGGVLLIGYEQFRLLSLKKNPKPSRRKNQPIEVQDDSKNKVLFDEIHEALINPGPDLVICDEGHRIKNSHASISQALKLMTTKRRIVLTGYPLQNNLMEYWCMVDFARPNYLGTKTEFCNMFERPIMNGQCIDSTESDIKLMRYRAHVLHSLLVGFVQRRSHTVLQLVLPQKEEYVLLCRMTPFQRTLYETFMNEVVRIQAVPNPLKAFAVCCKIWNHPDVLYHYLVERAKGEARDIDLEEVASVANAARDSTAAGVAGKPKKPAPRKKGGKKEKPAASITPYNTEQHSIQSPTPSDSSTRSTLPCNYPLNQPSVQNQGNNQLDGAPNYGQPGNNFPQQNTSQFYNQNNQFAGNSNFSSNFTEDANQGTFNDNTSCNFNMSQQMSGGGNNFIEPMGDSNTTDTKSYLDISTPQQNPKQPAENSATGGQFPHSFNNINMNNQNYNFNQSHNMPNFWGQSDNCNSQGDYFNSPYNPNFSNSNSNSSWSKPEDKPNILNTDGTYKFDMNESKRKINIISDIKLPSMFNSPQNSLTPVSQSSAFGASGDKKINIISDIKIGQVKKEEIDEKSDIKLEGEQLAKDLKHEEDVKKEEEMEEKKLAKQQEVNKTNLEVLFSKLANIKDKEDGIPYDWVIDLMKDYIPGVIGNSAKMEILFSIIKESLALGDRLLIFSQSLFTLDLIEKFLQSSVIPGDSVKWAKNSSYYRLDGSTSALEREKLINEFNSNPKIHLFLVSTRAGSLGINLIGANRVVVLDASWNPCHDTQAVCRVYRYGQRKPCFVYRLVADNCLEKKIYDRQINKQGMSDRIVDECNPDAHLTIKDVSTLCWDNKYDEGEEKDWSNVKDNYIDVVLQKVLEKYGRRLNCAPFQHESLLVDRKEKQLSQQEKRLAKKSYEREKQASRQPAYLTTTPRVHRPIASVRPMQQGNERPSRWIPAEHWQRQGMTAQEMTLPLDVVIPTNQPEKGNIVLKAGQKVLVLKSPKGVYMQLENGKIVAIKTAIKVKGKAEDSNDPTKLVKNILPPTAKINPSMSAMAQRKVVKPLSPGVAKMNIRSIKQPVPNLMTHIQNVGKKGLVGKSRPYTIGSEIAKSISNQKDDMLPSSSDDEPMPGMQEALTRDAKKTGGKITKMSSTDDINMKKRMMFLKNQVTIKKMTSPKAKNISALEKLEQSTSMALNENIPFQNSLDNITNNYKDDTLEAETSSLSSGDKQPSQPPSDASNHSDEVTYVSEQPPQYPSNTPQNLPVEPKLEPQSQEYNNYNYYNYQPYPHPAPAQGYTYPPQQPPYEMMQPYPPQQPQYAYGYQSYPPPQPHYVPPPQTGYDYNAAPPPQPMYPPPYHNPYPQQYPPPPHQAMYPPPQNTQSSAPQTYTDYQYQQMQTSTPNPPSQVTAPANQPVSTNSYYPSS